MATIIVEREFPRARFTAAELRDSEKTASWCMSLYRVRVLFHILGSDGGRIACAFEGPDAEALRSIERHAGLPPAQRIWAADVFPDAATNAAPPDSPRLTLSVVARTFDAPVSFDEIQAVEDRGQHCLSLYRVLFLRSYFSRDRRRMLCLYDAPDAESVRAANRQVGLPFDAVWTASIVHPIG